MCPWLPLMLTYNSELNRNAVHFLTTNLAELQLEYQYAYMPSQTYSLRNIVESAHYEIIAQTVYESLEAEEEVTEVVVAKSTRRNHIYAYARARDGRMRVFQVDFFGHGKDCVRMLAQVHNCGTMGTCRLYPCDMIMPEPICRNPGHI